MAPAGQKAPATHDEQLVLSAPPSMPLKVPELQGTTTPPVVQYPPTWHGLHAAALPPPKDSL